MASACDYSRFYPGAVCKVLIFENKSLSSGQFKKRCVQKMRFFLKKRDYAFHSIRGSDLAAQNRTQLKNALYDAQQATTV
jgi:hypothetical protein